MLGPLGGPELIIIGIVIILIFGVGKFSNLGRDLGSSIKEFRRAVKDEDEQKPNVQQASAPPPPQQQYNPPPAQPPQSSNQPSDKPNVF